MRQSIGSLGLVVTFALLAATASAATTTKAAGARPKASATARRVLPTIADDYPKALAKARAAHLPIFIEAWAPW